MKKLHLWRRRSAAAAAAHDALQAEANAADEAREPADRSAHPGADGQGADHEDTVPAAFYRSAG